jgi:hypothetical protein
MTKREIFALTDGGYNTKKTESFELLANRQQLAVSPRVGDRGAVTLACCMAFIAWHIEWKIGCVPRENFYVFNTVSLWDEEGHSLVHISQSESALSHGATQASWLDDYLLILATATSITAGRKLGPGSSLGAPRLSQRLSLSSWVTARERVAVGSANLVSVLYL